MVTAPYPISKITGEISQVLPETGKGNVVVSRPQNHQLESLNSCLVQKPNRFSLSMRLRQTFIKPLPINRLQRILKKQKNPRGSFIFLLTSWANSGYALQALDDAGCTHATADTHADHTVFFVAAF